MKRMKSYILLSILAIVLFSSIKRDFVEAKKEEVTDNIQLYYTYINRISSNFYIEGKVANISCSALGKSNTKSIKIIAILQKKSGTSWKTIKSFTASDTKNVYLNKKYTLSSKGKYRVKYQIIANGSEIDTIYDYDDY